MSIPKVINYCWFGKGQLPPKAIDCINSWKKYCPDYTIVRWDESNFDVNKYDFTREAYEKKKWAFVTDVARLDIIYNNGGIYLDTDVEIIKNIDDILDNELFIGFENSEYANTGLGFGAIQGNKLVKKNLDVYKEISFNDCNCISKIACPIITSKVLIEKGFKMNGKLQTLNGCTIYPVEYFCPMNYDTGKIKITENTYSIHHYTASWKSKFEMMNYNIEKKFNILFIKLLGEKNGKNFSHKIAKGISIFLKPFFRNKEN